MDEDYSPEGEIEDEEQEEEMDESQEIFDVNKRTPSAQQAGHKVFSPSHLRSAFCGSGQQLPSSITMHRRLVAAAVTAKPHTLHQ